MIKLLVISKQGEAKQARVTSTAGPDLGLWPVLSDGHTEAGQPAWDCVCVGIWGSRQAPGLGAPPGLVSPAKLIQSCGGQGTAPVLRGAWKEAGRPFRSWRTLLPADGAPLPPLLASPKALSLNSSLWRP